MAHGISAGDAVELGEVLASALGAVAQAQDRLDAHALARRAEYEAAVGEGPRLPPLWYTFRSVAVELELSASLASPPAGSGSRLFCRTLNPTTASLYGHRAAAGLRIRVIAAPAEPDPPRTAVAP